MLRKVTLTMFLVLVWSLATTKTQAQTKKYLILFKDRAGTSFSINQPSAYLSSKSIQRRRKQSIRIDSTDLPVLRRYIDSVSARGARILYSSRWLNGVVIETDPQTYLNVQDLPFVVNSQNLTIRKSPIFKQPWFHSFEIKGNLAATKAARKSQTFNLGLSEDQLKMLAMDSAQLRGYDGTGILLAVLDAGQFRTNRHEAFTHLYQSGRVVDVYDFVDMDTMLYDADNHGTSVLGCIAGKIPGSLLGTAPGISVAMYRSEDVQSEFEIECTNWVAAAERADSLGVDIINSSLGYYFFNDPLMNYNYAMMNGRTTTISKMATMAARKGILVVSSAGNEGNNSTWGGYITAPADADSILTVGAVSRSKSRVSFSSTGPSSDQRIKPEVCALGSSTIIPNSSQTTGIITASGTSFSAPLIAGFAASLWQAFPNFTAMEIRQLIIESASQFTSPDNLLGYGIPNFNNAISIGQGRLTSFFGNKQTILYPTIIPQTGEVVLMCIERITGQPAELEILDALGRSVHSERIEQLGTRAVIRLNLNLMPSGAYVCRLRTKGNMYTSRLVKE